MKKKILSVFLIILLTMVTIITMVNAVSSTTFEDFDGNYDGFIKIDPPVDTTIYFDNDGNVSTTSTNKYIEFDVSDNGIYLSFKATGIVVFKIYLKGGDGYRVYTFTPPVGEYSNLVCPNNNGDNIPQISHYGLIKIDIPEETTTTTTGTTTSTTTGTTATTTGTTTTQTTTGTTTTSTTTSTTTGTTATTTGTTTQPTTNITTSTSTPTTTSTDDIPKTGESDNFAGTIIGLTLIFLAGALYFIFHKKLLKT